MAASKSPRARLLHIRDEIEGVATIVRGLSFMQYQSSYMHRRAVERAVQIVSEAAKALPTDYHKSLRAEIGAYLIKEYPWPERGSAGFQVIEKSR